MWSDTNFFHEKHSYESLVQRMWAGEKVSRIGRLGLLVLSNAHDVKSWTQQTITQKMVDQGRSDIHIVFTMILCDTNFSI